MRKLKGAIQSSTIALLAVYGQSGEATVINGIKITAGQSVTISTTDTVQGSVRNSLGTITNNGVINANGMTHSGTLHNHGIINVNHSDFLVPAGLPKIVNYADGAITITSGMIHLYNSQGIIENAGKLNITNLVGDGSDIRDDHIILRGTVKNTGILSFSRMSSTNLCNYGGQSFNIVNEGTFELSEGSYCDLAEDIDTSNGYTTFTQNNGEARINGIFGAHSININAGTLSGNGTLRGTFADDTFHYGVTIAPGAPIGMLTLAPSADNPYLICSKCSVNIDINDPTNYDRLNVDSDFYLNNWTLNVNLRDGYVPAAGTQFTIVSSPSLYVKNSYTSNLPTLPNGRTWSVQNTGTELILTAN